MGRLGPVLLALLIVGGGALWAGDRAGVGHLVLRLDVGIAPLDRRKVRQALGFALNRQAILDGMVYGEGVALGPHIKARLGQNLGGYDAELARHLLIEAEILNAVELPVRLMMERPKTAWLARAAVIIARQLAAIGIKVEMVEEGRNVALRIERVERLSARDDLGEIALAEGP